VGDDLAGEQLGRCVVVDERGQRRRVGVERDGAERRPVGVIAPDELGREVLGVGGAATVADGEQPSAGTEDARQLSTPLGHDVDLVAEAIERPAEIVDVLGGPHAVRPSRSDVSHVVSMAVIVSAAMRFQP
jgi:hypothetical protein